MRFAITTVLIILNCIGLFAQNNSLPSPLQKAYAYNLKKNTSKAEHFFLKTIKRYPENTQAYLGLGLLYRNLSQFEREAEVYEKAYRSVRDGQNAFAIVYAEALFRSQQYGLAETVLNQWKQGKNGSQATALKKLERNIQFAQSAIRKPSSHLPVNMGDRINSGEDEYFPSITANDSVLVFTRKTKGIDEDFYWAKRDSCGGWFLARDLGSPPNSPQQEGAQMLSTDGRYLFFMRCENRSVNGWQEGGCDLYFSYSDQDAWSQAVPFGGMINTLHYEGTPSLSSDNRVMYFASDRPGGYGGLDIWMTVFKDGLWQVPVNLGPEINSEGNEFAPWIANDNQTLYFTSDGHPGFGGSDLFRSRRLNEGGWARPNNLGYPLNSGADEISFCLSADGTKGYFSSNRGGGFGNMDLYEVELDLEDQPESVVLLYGLVKDSLNQNKITYAQIEWSDPETGEQKYHFQSNSGDASFTSAIQLHERLALKVYRSGYLDLHDTISFEQKAIYPPDTFHISLLPNDYEPPRFDHLLVRKYYEKNEIALEEDAINEIKGKIKPYLDKKLTDFFVNGFTDDSGTPFINESISFARARAIGEILFNLGVPERNIHVQGWADANPLMPNTTEENRRMNRRVELVVRTPE